MGKAGFLGRRERAVSGTIRQEPGPSASGQAAPPCRPGRRADGNQDGHMARQSALLGKRQSGILRGPFQSYSR